MAVSIDSLKTELQGFFSDGIAVVVGSGLSAAEGMPGMLALENHLNAEMPKILKPADLKCWNAISAELAANKGLETALLTASPTPDVEEKIVKLTAELIENAESSILEEVISGTRTLPLSKLLPHLNPQPNRALPIITTNYERLIEVASEMIGWGVDSMFVGSTVGALNPAESARSFIKDVQIKPKRAIYSFRNRINIAKPHGSLDWYQHSSGPIRCAVKLDLPRLIITPGRNKYHRGYAIPFDKHREAGNTAIDKSARLLVLGYGFNDDHLETHLSPSLRLGKPSLILTHTLSENAKNVISASSNTIALSHDPHNPNGFLFTNNKEEIIFDYAPIWRVSTFVEKVLNP